MRYEGAWPEHHCKVGDGALLNETIPQEEDGSYSKCEMYVTNDSNKTTTCNDWLYYDDVGYTIVSEVIHPCNHSSYTCTQESFGTSK